MRIFFILSLILAVSSSVFAAETVKHASSAPSYSTGSGRLTAVGVSDTFWVTTGPSLSAMFSHNQDWIQTYLGVYGTKGDFNFSVGGVYKFTVAGTRATGFHVGPGAALGTINDEFAFAVFAAAGGHFSFSEHLMISIDAGPMITHTSNNTNFRMRPLGNLLGLSAFYVF